jgi:glycerol transport system ATP-binding protein
VHAYKIDAPIKIYLPILKMFVFDEAKHAIMFPINVSLPA